MGRDLDKLQVFKLAHQIVLEVYLISKGFPEDERFGLQSQLRRAAVSIAANIAEGSSRRQTRDWARFLEIALGSASETLYLLTLSNELGFVKVGQVSDCRNRTQHVIRALQKMISAMCPPA